MSATEELPVAEVGCDFYALPSAWLRMGYEASFHKLTFTRVALDQYQVLVSNEDGWIVRMNVSSNIVRKLRAVLGEVLDLGRPPEPPEPDAI